MEITQITKIKLEDAEMRALQTLKDAYKQCVTENCFKCDKCPLSVDGVCIGVHADNALEYLKRGIK